MSKQGDLLTLHGQLLAGDRRAASKIVELTIAPLVAIVERDVAGLHDRQDVEQTCFDALFKYLANPGAYNPQRAALMTYLVAIAKGTAKTLRRSQSRRSNHEGAYAARENPEERDPLALIQNEESMLGKIDWARFGSELVKDPGDAVIISLMKTGESALSVYAQAIGLAEDDDGLSEARRRVERIRGRARRMRNSASA